MAKEGVIGKDEVGWSLSMDMVKHEVTVVGLEVEGLPVRYQQRIEEGGGKADADEVPTQVLSG